jgi:microcin C transport system permease protein
VLVKRDASAVRSALFQETGLPVTAENWKVRYESEKIRQDRYQRRNGDKDKLPSYRSRAVIYQTYFSGLLQGDLGRSQIYNEPVDRMILSRIPVAAYFGLLTAFITYAVCLPLGVLKALKHRTFIDTASSVLIFLGYSIPGFALGAILLVHLGARMNYFPLFGLTSPDFDQMNDWAKVKDIAHHTVLPLLCYVVGSFAMLTMLTKNSLMDNLAADYVRTAMAKGVSFPKAVFGHAFRNSMIPIATSLGSLVEIFIGGSMLIETVFDIQGFGLMQYHSVLERDVPVIMGTLTIAALLMLVGQVLSDFIVAMVDPRIKFE